MTQRLNRLQVDTYCKQRRYIEAKLVHKSKTMPFTRQTRVPATLMCLLAIATLAQASGVFEIQITSLLDAYGRDLRDACCMWQNNSNPHDQIAPLRQPTPLSSIRNSLFNTGSSASATAAAASTNQQQQQQQQYFNNCDPTKCQLIIRICVNYYQSQIEPTQCTFGELSALVMKPNEPEVSVMSPYTSYTSIHKQSSSTFARLRLPASASSSPASSPLFESTQSPWAHHQQQRNNIHHQRMLQAASASATGASQPPSRALRSIAFNQPITFPFNFTWPGSFSLIVDAWYESPTGQLQQVPLSQQHYPFHRVQPQPQQAAVAAQQQQHAQNRLSAVYDLYKRQPIIRHSMHGWLAVKSDWTYESHMTENAVLAYSYRVLCETNYYGEQCNLLCKPRDDMYGHYTCSPQGSIQCLPGWSGNYCLEPICSPGCNATQGRCTRPNECNCRFGWSGPTCEQCVRYPGCMHGSCSRPHECICHEGWGGLLCNEDLNFCAHHKPCKNGGSCVNTGSGVGPYKCECSAGYSGKNCERSLTAANNSSSSTSSGSFNPANSSPQLPQHQQQLQQPTVLASIVQQALHQHRETPIATASNQRPQQPQHSKHSNGPFAGIQAASQQQMSHPAYHMHHAQQTDYKVVLAYAAIIASMVVLVVVLLIRLIVDRAYQRQWHQESNHVDDVATMQNNQNLHRSRTSLNYGTTGAAPAYGGSASTYGSWLASAAHYAAANVLGSTYGTTSRSTCSRRRSSEKTRTATDAQQGGYDSPDSGCSAATSTASGSFESINAADLARRAHNLRHYQSEHALHYQPSEHQQQQQQQLYGQHRQQQSESERKQEQQQQEQSHQQQQQQHQQQQQQQQNSLPPPPPYTLSQDTRPSTSLYGMHAGAYQAASSLYGTPGTSRAHAAALSQSLYNNSTYGRSAPTLLHAASTGAPVALTAAAAEPAAAAAAVAAAAAQGSAAASTSAAYQSPYYVIYHIPL